MSGLLDGRLPDAGRLQPTPPLGAGGVVGCEVASIVGAKVGASRVASGVCRVGAGVIIVARAVGAGVGAGVEVATGGGGGVLVGVGAIDGGTTPERTPLCRTT